MVPASVNDQHGYLHIDLYLYNYCLRGKWFFCLCRYAASSLIKWQPPLGADNIFRHRSWVTDRLMAGSLIYLYLSPASLIHNYITITIMPLPAYVKTQGQSLKLYGMCVYVCHFCVVIFVWHMPVAVSYRLLYLIDIVHLAERLGSVEIKLSWYNFLSPCVLWYIIIVWSNSGFLQDIPKLLSRDFLFESW
jgi:hypothetical protein